MKSIGNVGVDDITSDAIYVKEKEKQAQIVGPLARRTSGDIILNLQYEIKVRTGNPSNKLSGCSFLDNGEIIFSEYNLSNSTDRVTLHDGHGKFIRVILALNSDPGPFFDITSIDTNTIAVSTGIRIRIVNIKTHKILLTIENDHRCYGITHYDDTLYYCSSNEGIRRFALKTGISKFWKTNTSELLIPTMIGPFSYISCDENKLLYTSDTETVNCCDMNGKPIWSFQNTAVLRSPRGVVVDNEGFVFVAGEKSKNIVAISPDGNSSKEVYYISSPRAMCYDKNENKILVGNTGKKVFWFEIE
jgi:outer membrane protein assembly factor BamB